MLRVEDKAWIFEGEPESVEQVDGYWMDVTPMPKVTCGNAVDVDGYGDSLDDSLWGGSSLAAAGGLLGCAHISNKKHTFQPARVVIYQAAGVSPFAKRLL